MRTIIRLSLRGAAAFGWVFLAMLTCGPSHAFEKGEIILSKSTFIYLADPDTQALDSYNFAYLPAGTRLRYEGKSITEFGKRRFLVHSETGSYGYIREDQIWNLTASTTPTGKIGIFQRKYKHEGSVQNIMSFEIYFSRGEKYVVLDREIDSWLIQVDLNDKFTNDKGTPIFELTPGTRVTLNINVPTEYLTVIDFSKLGKTAASTIDGGSGLQPAAASSGQPMWFSHPCSGKASLTASRGSKSPATRRTTGSYALTSVAAWILRSSSCHSASPRSRKPRKSRSSPKPKT